MSVAKGSVIVGLLAGAGVAAASDTPASRPAPIFDWLDKSIWRRIDIMGHRSLGFHRHNVTGDREAFDSLNYFGQGDRQFTDTGMVTIIGDKVLGFFNFNMTLVDDRFSDPQSKRIWLGYTRNGFSVGYGDLTSASLLNTNDFARYTKTLSGTTLGYQKGRFAFKALRTETKSSARTRSLQGSNSPGPYYLGDSQIINDSEEVKVDGVSMKQGQDYTINYQSGAITFTTRMIAPTSTIVVAYETLGFNSTPGVIQGAGLSYDMGKFGRLGLTAMEQRSGGSTGLNSRTDKFQGFGDPTAAYVLDFEPLTSRPIIVEVNGAIQILNVDYHFGEDAAHNPVYTFIFFNRFIPSTDEVQVTYTPRPVQTIDGDRRVLGFDYRLPLGKKGFLSYSQAQGELLNELNPMKGTARGLRGEYAFGDFKLRGSIRDVPSTFVTVESRSFNRNEKAIDVGLDYKKKNYSWGVSATNSNIAYRTIGSDNTVKLNESKYGNQRAYISYAPDQTKGLTWSLEHNRSQSQYLGNDSKIDSTTFSALKNFGGLHTRLALEHQSGIGPVTVGTETKRGNVSLDAIRLFADYTTPNGWFFGTRTSLSNTKSLGKSGKGNDITLSTSYKPGTGPFDFEASFTASNSGDLANLGSFQNGSGLGFGGNGFSGAGSVSGFLNGGSNYRTLSVTPNYRLNKKATLTGRFYQTRTSGSYYANTESLSYGLGMTLDLGGGTLFTSNLDQSNTRFLGQSLKTQSTSIEAALFGSPKGPWSYRLGVNALLSGGNSDYGQDSLGLDAYLRYRINPRSNANIQVTMGRTSGYLPQSDNFVGAFYEYQIYKNVALVGSYKWRKVTNNSITSGSLGAYRSSGFDLELNFNFGG